jgi:hypothetical protein
MVNNRTVSYTIVEIYLSERAGFRAPQIFLRYPVHRGSFGIKLA